MGISRVLFLSSSLTAESFNLGMGVKGLLPIISLSLKLSLGLLKFFSPHQKQSYLNHFITYLKKSFCVVEFA